MQTKTERPIVSICMPSLNSRKYLQARLESISSQSLASWELIVVDSGSNDGTWEILLEHALHEPRMRLYQAPQEGIYPALNRCIDLSRGAYVYIAMSDDWMADDCLAKMVVALESTPECDIAHCMLRIIGDCTEEMNRWLQQQSLFAISSGELMGAEHVRKAPFDGLLHMYGSPVYTSLVQLLIRRPLFQRVGRFEGRWGSIGDFHWGMRATLVASTVHVPNTWAGWRIHSEQATRSAEIGTHEHWQKTEDMITDALKLAWADIPDSIKKGLQGGWRDYFSRRRMLQFDLECRSTKLTRLTFLLLQLLRGSGAARDYLASRLGAGDFMTTAATVEVVKRWLGSVEGPDQYIVPA